MKITAIQTSPSGFEIEVGGTFHKATYREILAGQGIVIVPPALQAGTKVASQNPADEEAPLMEIENAIESKELGAAITKWAQGKTPDGIHQVKIEAK